MQHFGESHRKTPAQNTRDSVASISTAFPLKDVEKGFKRGEFLLEIFGEYRYNKTEVV